MTDKTEKSILDLDDLEARSHDLDDATADEVAGGFFSKFNKFQKKSKKGASPVKKSKPTEASKPKSKPVKSAAPSKPKPSTPKTKPRR